MAHHEHTARTARNFPAVGAGPVDPFQKRRELAAEGVVANAAPDLARVGEILVRHAAIRAGQPAARFFLLLLRRLPEQSFQEIIDRELPRVRGRHEILVACRAFLAEILVHLSLGTDLRDMDARLVPMAIVAQHQKIPLMKVVPAS